MTYTEYKTINIIIEQVKLDFSLAKRISEERATEYIKGPMLIAWYDGN